MTNGYTWACISFGRAVGRNSFAASAFYDVEVFPLLCPRACEIFPFSKLPLPAIKLSPKTARNRSDRGAVKPRGTAAASLVPSVQA